MADSYDLGTTFFRTDKTDKVFPVFAFTQENVPLGNSISMCLAFHWNEASKGKHYETMKMVEELPQCGTTLSEKFLWNEDDTIFGIDVPGWVQHVNDAGCSDEDCPDYCLNKYGGAFIDGVNKHVCYSYDVLDKICVVIKYDEKKDQYVYHGGCFPDGMHYQMRPATFGEIEKFGKVDIEVRDLSDPITQAGEMSNYKYGFGTFWRYIGCFMNILLIAALCLLGYAAFFIYREKNRGPMDNLRKSEQYVDDINQGAYN